MKLLFEHDNVAMLYSLKNILEKHGIGIMIHGENGLTMGPQFGITNIFGQLWVTDENEFDQAKSIIESVLAASEGDQWQCESCGELNAPSFETCWKCASAPSKDYYDH